MYGILVSEKSRTLVYWKKKTNHSLFLFFISLTAVDSFFENEICYK